MMIQGMGVRGDEDDWKCRHDGQVKSSLEVSVTEWLEEKTACLHFKTKGKSWTVKGAD